jgi:hypothetical protein|tara:strand:+ start:634 stop:798 length:165 start_codon:yes stop_codon:yes gene_type:complete
MSEKIPVYLDEEQITMLYDIISTQFDAKGYQSSKNLIEICDAFTDAIEQFPNEE